jgi:hypothetical protein
MSDSKPEEEGVPPAEEPAEDGNEAPEPDMPNGGGRKAPVEDDASDRDGHAASPETVQVVNNHFWAGTRAGGATFGFGMAARSGAASTGPLEGATIVAAVEHYVRPRSYGDALGALRSDGVVVLTGAPGQGKQTGALALLRDVLPAAPIVSLPPNADLEKLAGRDYESGHGYVVFRWFGTNSGTEAEHAWQRVSARMRDAKAYLVVTAAERPRLTPESVRYVAWECPELGAALRAHTGDAVPEATIEEIVQHLPPGTSMTDIVRVAAKVGDGTEPRAAVDEVLQQSMRQEVTDWFDKEPARREIVDITTLAFLAGTDERAFDTARDRLSAAFEKAMPPPEPPAAEPPGRGESAPGTETALPQDRQRLHGNPLITLTREVMEGVPRRAMVFREKDHRRYVLEQLTDRFGVRFWDAVRTWLAEMVVDRSLQMTVAYGLMLLAYAAFDEIEASYLNPWAAGKNGWPHRYTAVFTLWFMCFDETLDPVALRTAVRWATHGSPEQRRTAVMAFAGELGVRYPTEAANRLWQLIAQHNDLSEMAAAGFGSLFATLIAGRAKADPLIELIGARLQKTSPYGRTRVRYRWTLHTALAMFDIPSPATGRPAIAEYLVGDPDRIAAVGRIWAALLKNRPFRHQALRALLKALRALETLSADPERDARALGDALGEALPEDEHAALKTDFTRLARSGGGRRRPDALAQIMLAALVRAHRRNHGGMQ